MHSFFPASYIGGRKERRNTRREESLTCFYSSCLMTAPKLSTTYYITVEACCVAEGEVGEEGLGMRL